MKSPGNEILVRMKVEEVRLTNDGVQYKARTMGEGFHDSVIVHEDDLVPKDWKEVDHGFVPKRQ
jgi:hypothetical protein